MIKKTIESSGEVSITINGDNFMYIDLFDGDNSQKTLEETLIALDGVADCILPFESEDGSVLNAIDLLRKDATTFLKALRIARRVIVEHYGEQYKIEIEDRDVD